MENEPHYLLLCNFNYLEPGFWHAVHTIALAAKDVSSKEFFADFARRIFSSLPDIKVRLFLLWYLDTYPPSTFSLRDNRNRDMGYLFWSWSLQQVASKQKNELPSLDVLFENLTNGGTCSKCT